MKKSILLAAILAATITPAPAAMMASPDEAVLLAGSEAFNAHELLCSSWECIGSVKTLKLRCRVEAVTPANKKTILQEMGLGEARKRLVEQNPVRGKHIFRSQFTREPMLAYLLTDKTALGCAFQGSPEFAEALVAGDSK